MTSELELGQRDTNQGSLLTDTEVVEKPTKEETVVENATPDYAAGLVSTQVGLPCSAAMGMQATEHFQLFPGLTQPK